MSAYYNWLNSLYNKNRNEFMQWNNLKWLNSYDALSYQNTRDVLVKNIEENFLFKNTKPFYKQISNGCKICGNGKWSCLFITNKCNANCFYCPAEQNNDEIPSSQGLEFNSAEKYADYINNFGFEGVSFSGGEPLIFFERTLNYLKAVKQRCANTPYTWLYTNGILTNQQKLNQLSDAGLDEIRFDIGATGFSLDNVKKAKGIIPNITIEIPAVPEKKELIKDILYEMINVGVTNLNLHHMRLTKYNVKNLVKREYTIIPSERPLILESELAALEIVNFASENKMDIGVNYCSFHFKNRFQKAGFRKIIAQKLFSKSQITEQGYIREFNGNSITYSQVGISQMKNSFIINKTDINGESYYYYQIKILHYNNITEYHRKCIQNIINNEPDKIPEDEILFNVWHCEYIEKGLRDY